MNAILYSRENCPHCVRAKFTLEKHNIPYQVIDAGVHRDALISRVIDTGAPAPKSVPQIFIDDQYIGGADDLEKFLAS